MIARVARGGIALEPGLVEHRGKGGEAVAFKLGGVFDERDEVELALPDEEGDGGVIGLLGGGRRHL